MQFAKYRKLIVAGLGLAVLAIFEFGGVNVAEWLDLGCSPADIECSHETAGQIVEGVVMLATALGVWGLPNTEKGHA